MARKNFSLVTELPGLRFTREQLEMMNQRYGFASRYCAGRDVLDAGCGGGQGIRYLGSCARRAVGGDVMAVSVEHARRGHGGDRVQWLCMDGQTLPLAAGSVDVVLVFDVIYWLEDQQALFREVTRVLRRPGWLIVATINPLRIDFNPSPLAAHYPSGAELAAMFGAHGYDVTTYHSFPVRSESAVDRLRIRLKSIASHLHLIPAGGTTKDLLKRIFLGPLLTIPDKLEPDLTRVPGMVVAPSSEVSSYKYVYCVGHIQ
jgi:SAM-dependent methyltransferase